MDMRALQQAAQIADPIERARAFTRLMTEDQALYTEAARYRRHAIAEARQAGMTLEQVAAQLGVSPGRVSQMRKGPAAKAPEPPAAEPPKVLVQRAIPTEPTTRGSISLYLVEAERQGVQGERRMLYVGREPASDHVAACLHVDPDIDVVARRKLMTANGAPVRIAASYFRADLFGDTRMNEPDFVRPSLQSAIEDLGYRFGHAEENLTARPPTEFERVTLELEGGEWIVQVLRATYSTEGTPVHTLETICAASRHVFPIGQVAGAGEF